VLLKKAPFVTADSGVVDRTRMYFALALVDEAPSTEIMVGASSIS
jgi:hypothetical protein